MRIILKKTSVRSCPFSFHTGLKMKRLEFSPPKFLCLCAYVNALRDSFDIFFSAIFNVCRLPWHLFSH